MSDDSAPASRASDDAASPASASAPASASTPASAADPRSGAVLPAGAPGPGASAHTEPEPAEREPVAEVRAEPVPPSATSADAGSPGRALGMRRDRPFVFGFLVTLGGLGALVLGLAITSLSTVLIYIALALFAALGLDPAVRFLERRRLSRALSVVVVIAALIVVVALVLWTILPVVIEQIASFVRSVPGMIGDFQRSDLYRALDDQFGDQFQGLVGDVQTFLTDPGNIASIGGGALQLGADIATGISGVVVVLVLTLYFVATLPTMKKALLRLVPARDRLRTSDITDQITDSVGGYVMGMVVLAFCNAVLAFLLYMFLGLPFPPLMATVAFCITLIPLVGSVLFWAIATGLALFTDPVSALIFAVVYLVYMQIEAYVLTPRVMNKAVSVPGSLVVIGALAGGTLLGLLGALVAVPVTASLLIIVKQVWVPRQDARV